MLQVRDAIPFLLEHRLLSERMLIENDVSVVNISRRNRNLVVDIGKDTGYFLKQGGAPGDTTTAREAEVYQVLLLPDNGPTRMARFVPQYVAYDSGRDVLVLKKVQDAKSLGLYQAGAGRYARTPSKALAAALSTLHRLGHEPPLGHWEQPIPDETPWALSFHRPTVDILRNVSRANLYLFEVVQAYPTLCAHLDALRMEWERHALIHGDIRNENCLVVPSPGSKRRTRVVVVDWEGTCLGDPCWDLGSFLADRLRAWVRSIPMSDPETLERAIDLARFPLHRLAPSVQAFWHAYVRHMDHDSRTAGEQLVRSVRFSAPRLLQLAYEELPGSVMLTGHVALLLQLSSNLLQQPLQAARHLFGISTHTADRNVGMA